MMIYCLEILPFSTRNAIFNEYFRTLLCCSRHFFGTWVKELEKYYSKIGAVQYSTGTILNTQYGTGTWYVPVQVLYYCIVQYRYTEETSVF